MFKNKKLEKIVDDCNTIMEDITAQTVCFTGHRPQKLPWGFNENDVRCLAMKEVAKLEIENAIINGGKKHFISGMALGFDMICAELVLELKKDYPFITLECAIPCKGQESKWSTDQQKRYHNIVKQADTTRCIYNHYIDGCMQERNRYMINNSSMVIALFNGKPGGTKITIDYAKQKGLEIVVIEP